MRSVLFVALALALGAGAGAGAAQAAPVAQTVDAVLAANRAAMTGVPARGGLTAAYDFSGQGLTGTWIRISDLATGAFRQDADAKVVSQGDGYDGRLPWQRDFSGTYTSQEGGDRVPVAVSEAYRNANLWWRADRGGAMITYAGRETRDGRAFDRLAVTPRGGKPFEAWFDAETHLMMRVDEDQQFFHTKLNFDDYRPTAAGMQAHKLSVDFGTGPENLQYLTLARLDLVPPRPLSAYALPKDKPQNGAIESGAEKVVLPFRLLNNHVYIEAKVNGRGPYTFIVDTGGHTLLSPKLVREAGLTPAGQVVSSGAGEKTELSGFVHVDDIALGDLHLRNQTGLALEVYDPAIEGIHIEGMVGFELFRRFAVQLDYGAKTMTLWNPEKFRPTAALGTAIPFKFYDHLPFVQGDIAGLPARFDIDTGSRTEIDVTSPFAAKAGLKARYPKGVSTIVGWGVGGPSRSYVFRLPSLTIGGIRVENVAAGLSETRGGSISDPNYEGNIGSGFLKRFVVTFDYAHQTMWLKPLTPAPEDAGRFDRSGLWLNASPEGYKVTAIAAGSAGADAGLKEGDLITAIDGKPARMEALSDTRELLRATPAGTIVQLAVKRGADTITVPLTLKDLI